MPSFVRSATVTVDALPSFVAAQALYRSAGFVDMPPYYDTPIAGTVFLKLNLALK